jgi:hypothetical protein
MRGISKPLSIYGTRMADEQEPEELEIDPLDEEDDELPPLTDEAEAYLAKEARRGEQGLGQFPFHCPTEAEDQPPNLSMISDWTPAFLSLSRKLWRKEWIT